MNDEIKVQVVNYGEGRNYVLRYIDPISGKQKTKTSGTRNEQEAIKAAGVWQDELNSGRYVAPSRITWEQFKTRYLEEKVSSLAPRTAETVHSAFAHVDRLLAPDKLAKLTPEALSRFQAKLRKTGNRETSIASSLRTLKAALSWAVAMGLLVNMPKVNMPKRAKGQSLSRSRAVTLEEHERILAAVVKVRPNDTADWQRYLTGLWLSGLRLSESTALSWDDDAPLAVDLSGRHPRLRIYRQAQKSGRDEYLPLTPDFGDFILATPEAKRAGQVFKLRDQKTGRLLLAHHVGIIVGRIAKKAGVVVRREAGEDKKTGEPKAVVKYATPHDYRRAFGCRWARKVMPAVLQRLMRHDDIKTTMAYYVDLDADELADALWADHDRQGNTLGNTGPKRKAANRRKSLPRKGVADGT